MIFFDIHTHKVIDSKADTISIISSFPKSSNTFYSIGIHPWDVRDNLSEKLTLIESAAHKSNILAIGEIGLDKTCKNDFELQKEIFIKQLGIARKCAKAVIIHCVRAFDEVLKITKGFEFPIIMHGFNKGAVLAERFINRGCFLSFGKSLFDANSKSANAFEKTPLNQIFLETDEFDIPIQEIYKKASQIKDIEIHIIAKQIEDNFRKVFNGFE